MGKTINKLTLSELIELKNVVDYISEEYAKDLTTYATINKDNSFANITPTDKIKYEKRLLSMNLSRKIKQRMEEIVEEYYD